MHKAVYEYVGLVLILVDLIWVETEEEGTDLWHSPKRNKNAYNGGTPFKSVFFFSFDDRVYLQRKRTAFKENSLSSKSTPKSGSITEKQASKSYSTLQEKWKINQVY